MCIWRSWYKLLSGRRFEHQVSSLVVYKTTMHDTVWVDTRVRIYRSWSLCVALMVSDGGFDVATWLYTPWWVGNILIYVLFNRISWWWVCPSQTICGTRSTWHSLERCYKGFNSLYYINFFKKWLWKKLTLGELMEMNRSFFFFDKLYSPFNSPAICRIWKILTYIIEYTFLQVLYLNLKFKWNILIIINHSKWLEYITFLLKCRHFCYEFILTGYFVFLFRTNYDYILFNIVRSTQYFVSPI